MNHNSINTAIMWYVDTITPIFDKYTIKGWVGCKTNTITHISIDGNDIEYKPSIRKDVEEIYTDYQSVIGFQIIVNKEQISEGVNIHFVSGDTEQIESLNKFFTFYSGFGIGNKNLIVVDDFYYEPDMIRDYAINNLKFSNSDYHRGRRSEKFILNGTKEKLEAILGRTILNWNSPNYANGVFQYCTSYDPIVYHVDSQQFAAVVFLTPDAPLESGTATYRSKITGKTRLESNDTEYQKTFKGVSNDMNFYDSTSFEVVDKVSNVYNRLVMWDAKAIHAATNYFGDSIENARFFQLFFFDVE